MKRLFMNALFVSVCAVSFKGYAQFAPAALLPGTSAIHKDSSAFVDWAVSCKLNPGFQDISAPGAGYADVGDSSSAVGKAGLNGTVSLGDGGYAVLQFNTPVKDLPGPDLAVFENGFDDSFLELAFVEVSSDGINYFRFPATSNTDTVTQTGSFGLTDPTKIHNLAGKYRALYGTPFNLEDIPDNLLLNKQAITHVKVIDVVGSLQQAYCTRDQYGHKVNDPWPTPFGSSGFDLDAVGVIHNQNSVGVKENENPVVRIYPNPVKDRLNIQTGPLENISVNITTVSGTVVMDAEQNHYGSYDLSALEPGVYFVKIASGQKTRTLKLIKL